MNSIVRYSLILITHDADDGVTLARGQSRKVTGDFPSTSKNDKFHAARQCLSGRSTAESDFGVSLS